MPSLGPPQAARIPRIAGRAPSREDFLRYLQLEMNLEALLKLRSKTN